MLPGAPPVTEGQGRGSNDCCIAKVGLPAEQHWQQKGNPGESAVGDRSLERQPRGVLIVGDPSLEGQPMAQARYVLGLIILDN